jgi:hypothetical protein
MSRLLLEICPERLPAANGAGGGDLPPILICAREGHDALAFDGTLGGKPLILRIGENGYALEQPSANEPAPLGLGQWHAAEGWKLRVTQAAVPDSNLSLSGAENPSWAAPELRITTYDGDRVKRLRCMLPVEDGSQLIVGRGGAKADLIVEDEHVSRSHLRFFVDNGQQMVEDLGSRWGTKLNGQPLTDPKALKHGDEIRLGKSTINYICYWDILPQVDASQQKASGADDLQAMPVDIPAASRSQPPATPQGKAPMPAPTPPTPPAPPEKPAPPKKEPDAKAKPAVPEPQKPPPPEAKQPEKPATPEKPKPAPPPKQPERGSALPWAIALVILLLAGMAYLAYLVFHKS